MLDRLDNGDRKERLSVALNVLAIGLAFVRPLVSQLLFVVGASLWFVPDRRIEQVIVSE